jgi:flagellar basal-body rod protein FlgG
MERALWIAKTGLEAQRTRLATISNNLANANTTGFKAGRAEFQDLIYQNVRFQGAASSQDRILPSGLQIGTGVETQSIQRMHVQGNMQLTENELDIAIQGRGFFQIQLPNGDIAYTRDGTFNLNGDGEIVTPEGYQLLPGFVVPPEATAVSISGDGQVQAIIPGQAAPQDLGQIELAVFVNPVGLFSEGGNLYTETLASGAPINLIPGEDGSGRLLQGYLEASNVNTVGELVSLIEAQRTYDMNSKAISAADQMLQRLANL